MNASLHRSPNTVRDVCVWYSRHHSIKCSAFVSHSSPFLTAPSLLFLFLYAVQARTGEKKRRSFSHCVITRMLPFDWLAVLSWKSWTENSEAEERFVTLKSESDAAGQRAASVPLMFTFSRTHRIQRESQENKRLAPIWKWSCFGFTTQRRTTERCKFDLSCGDNSHFHTSDIFMNQESFCLVPAPGFSSMVQQQLGGAQNTDHWLFKCNVPHVDNSHF